MRLGTRPAVKNAACTTGGHRENGAFRICQTGLTPVSEPSDERAAEGWPEIDHAVVQALALSTKAANALHSPGVTRRS